MRLSENGNTSLHLAALPVKLTTHMNQSQFSFCCKVMSSSFPLPMRSYKPFIAAESDMIIYHLPHITIAPLSCLVMRHTYYKAR